MKNPHATDKKAFAKQLWLLFSQAVTIGCGLIFAYEALLGRSAEAPAEKSDPIAAIATGELVAAANNFSAAVERAAPAVVNIFSRRLVPGQHAEELGSDWNNFPELHMSALGSGVIVAANGSILTNYHVVEDASNLFVALADGRRFEARLLGSDPETDLALLKVDAESLPVIELGQSENLQIGQAVLAIGNPFDVGQTVTYGIVSALGRHGFGLNNYEDFIQTDAAINQGNSGGALVDLTGALVGINSAIFSPDQSEGSVGIGFAIPTSIVREVLPAMMAGRHIERGYLGFVPREFGEELAQDLGLAVRSGVLVKEVIAESPAADAGMHTFDIILAINGRPVKHANRMLQQIAQLVPGTNVKVDILRGTTRMALNVRASTRPLGSREREVLIPLPEEEVEAQ